MTAGIVYISKRHRLFRLLFMQDENDHATQRIADVIEDVNRNMYT